VAKKKRSRATLRTLAVATAGLGLGFVRQVLGERAEGDLTLLSTDHLVCIRSVLRESSLNDEIGICVAGLARAARDRTLEVEPDSMHPSRREADLVVVQFCLLEEMIHEEGFLAVAVAGDEAGQAVPILQVDLHELAILKKAVHTGKVIGRSRGFLRPSGLGKSQRTRQQSRHCPWFHHRAHHVCCGPWHQRPLAASNQTQAQVCLGPGGKGPFFAHTFTRSNLGTSGLLRFPEFSPIYCFIILTSRCSFCMASGDAQFGVSSLSQRVPRFVLELEAWHRVFWRNLGDLLLRRSPGPLRLSSAPVPFWPDVFVATPVPWGRLRQSFLYHIFVITALWGLSETYWLRPRVSIKTTTRNTTLIYYQVSEYQVSEYLPPVFSPSPSAKVARLGEPAYSKQPIISLPMRPDNARQTIVNPTAPELVTHEIKLPNLVVSTSTPAPPVAAATRSASQLTLPWLAAAPVPPPEENTSRRVADLSLQSRAPSVAEPPPEPISAERKLGDINVAHAEPQVAAPKLAAAEQRASAGQAQQARSVPAPPSSISVGGSGLQSAGQLLALGLDPAPPSGPIEVPAGSRHGVFAATPEGKPGAAGTADISAGEVGQGGIGEGGFSGAGNRTGGGPAGIYIGPAPAGSTAAPTAGKASAGTFAEAQKRVMVAAARPAADISPEIPDANLSPTPAPGTVEQEVFGPRKYYSMILNMPNLTSAGGSWIVRFATLKPTSDQSDLTAPVAVHKVDPAYPSSLMRARVEGTVTLYAIIRADGSVDGVKILRGVDDTLDENARLALSHWQFRPATRHGVAVDLEAVVQIPFTARKLPF
jgi:TonB family protein